MGPTYRLGRKKIQCSCCKSGICLESGVDDSLSRWYTPRAGRSEPGCIVNNGEGELCHVASGVRSEVKLKLGLRLARASQLLADWAKATTSFTPLINHRENIIYRFLGCYSYMKRLRILSCSRYLGLFQQKSLDRDF